MDFFVPFAGTREQAERVYRAIAKFNGATVTSARIASISWQHSNRVLIAQVGEPLDEHFGTYDQPVLAIFEHVNCYLICTASRGGLRGDPVLAGKRSAVQTTYFDDELPDALR